MLDAMGDVVLQHLLLDPPQRGANRRDLRDDVDAVAVPVDHFREAADLALDPAQAFLTGCLDVFPHAAYIPPEGIGFNGRSFGMAAEIKTGCCGGHGDHKAHGHHHHHAAPKAGARDPVCGMTVDPATSKHRLDHEGTTYHFCSAGCRGKFAADPAKYLNKAAAPSADDPEGTIYTCPMH